MFCVNPARRLRRCSRAAWSRCEHMRACAGGKLAARSLAALQCRGHFAERQIEHVVQQKGSPLERRQPVECQEQRDGQILGVAGGWACAASWTHTGGWSNAMPTTSVSTAYLAVPESIHKLSNAAASCSCVNSNPFLLKAKNSSEGQAARIRPRVV